VWSEQRAFVLRHATPIIFFFLLAAAATWPLATDLRGRTLVGPDPMIDLWTVHWLASHALSPSTLFAGNIFHPEPHAVVYSDLSLGTAVLVLPLRPFVSDPIPLYNSGLLLALAFAGWSFAALARALTGNAWAGVLAGTLATFGSHQMSHIYHLNLLTTGWLALFLLALHRLLQKPTPGAVILAGVSFAITAQSSGYYAVAGAVIALVFAGVQWRALAQRRVLAAAASAALVAALLIAPYAQAFRDVRSRERLRRPVGMSANMAFDPTRDLTSHGYVYRAALGSGGERLFPGLLSLVLAGCALARRRTHAGTYALAVGVLLALSLGPRLRLGALTLPLPYAALFAVPPLDSMRHPYTFAAVATMLLAVLAAIGWAGLGMARRPWAGAVVVLLAVVETLAPRPRLQSYGDDLPPVYRMLEELPSGPILEVPVFTPETLLWAARHGRPTLNGIGAFVPGATMVLERTIRNHWLRNTDRDVDDGATAWNLVQNFPLRYLIVPAGRKPETRVLVEALSRSRVFVSVAEAPDGDRIYEVRKDALPSANPGQGREEPGEVLGEQAQPIGDEK
jgi:hypothetical protein